MEAIKKLLGENFNEKVEQAINAEIEAQVEKGGAKYVPKLKYDSINEHFKKLQEDLNQRDTELAKMKDLATGNDALTKKIEEMQNAYETEKKDYESKMQKTTQEALLKVELSKYKPRSEKALRAELDFEKITFEGDKVKGLAEQIEAFKADENLKFLLKEDKPEPPSGTGIKTQGSGVKVEENPTIPNII